MRLSAIINEYGVPSTRSERNLASQLDDVPAAAEERYKQQIKVLADARELLTQLPDRQVSERQRRSEKAAMLKERLKMIRQMLPFLSRSAAKALQAEMKQIASQLALLQSEAEGSTMGTNDTTTSVIQSIKSNTEQKEKNLADQASDQNRQNPQPSPGAASGEQGWKSRYEQDRQLKEDINELKTLFRNVLAALKRKPLSAPSRQTAEYAVHLRVYAVIPDKSGTVAVNI